MEWNEILAMIFSAIAMQVLGFAFNRISRHKAELSTTGEYTMSLPNGYRILAFVCLVIAVIFIVGMIFFYEPGLIFIGTLMVLFFGGFGVYLLMCYRNHRVRFTDIYFSVTSWTGKERKIWWVDIRDMKYGVNSGYVKITAPNAKVGVSYHLKGFKTFLAMMERQTSYRIKDLRLPFQF